jgi:uncharacterized protein YbjQ (UPF0145 family)
MLISTMNDLPGYDIIEAIDIARGSAVRARHIGRDIPAVFRSVVGGEIREYTQLMAEAIEQALERMIADAERLDADAVVNVRFTTSLVLQESSEILAYGTAVKVLRK